MIDIEDFTTKELLNELRRRTEQVGHRRKPDTPPAVDWWQVINDLRIRGYASITIGQAIGVPRSTIIDWSLCRYEPRFSDAERLLRLWSSVLGKPVEQVPR